MLIVLLFLFAFSTGLIFRKLISTRHNKKWGGITMTDPGRHRADTDGSDLSSIEAIEPWVFQHHLYQTMDFINTEEAFKWVVSKARKGRAESWVIQVPRAVQWTGALGKTATIEEFKDYFLDSFPKRTRGVELTDAHS